MSDTLAGLRRKISSARQLGDVVRTMKMLAAVGIAQHERAVRSLAEYRRTVDLGLTACARRLGAGAWGEEQREGKGPTGAVVLGSDQGLVGRFNEALADEVRGRLAGRAPAALWVVGERLAAHLEEGGLACTSTYGAPASLEGIGRCVGRLLDDLLAHVRERPGAEVWVMHNRPGRQAPFEPHAQALLPLDRGWLARAADGPWPTRLPPEALFDPRACLEALVREFLFLVLYQACAESLASENACRLEAMQRAERNINDLLEVLVKAFHRRRQDGIDAELFDVVAGFEALAPQTPEPRR